MDNEQTNGQDKQPEATNYMAGLFQTHAENFSDSMKSAVATGLQCAGIVVGGLLVVAATTVTVCAVARAVTKND